MGVAFYARCGALNVVLHPVRTRLAGGSGNRPPQPGEGAKPLPDEFGD